MLAEDRKPPDSLWQQAMISSRLLERRRSRRDPIAVECDAVGVVVLGSLHAESSS